MDFMEPDFEFDLDEGEYTAYKDLTPADIEEQTRNLRKVEEATDYKTVSNDGAHDVVLQSTNSYESEQLQSSFNDKDHTLLNLFQEPVEMPQNTVEENQPTENVPRRGKIFYTHLKELQGRPVLSREDDSPPLVELNQCRDDKEDNDRGSETDEFKSCESDESANNQRQLQDQAEMFATDHDSDVEILEAKINAAWHHDGHDSDVEILEMTPTPVGYLEEGEHYNENESQCDGQSETSQEQEPLSVELGEEFGLGPESPECDIRIDEIENQDQDDDEDGDEWVVQGKKKCDKRKRHEERVIEDAKSTARKLLQNLTLMNMDKVVKKFMQSKYKYFETEDRMHLFVRIVFEFIVDNPTKFAHVAIRMVKAIIGNLTSKGHASGKPLGKLLLNHTQEEFNSYLYNESLILLEHSDEQFDPLKRETWRLEVEAKRYLVHQRLVALIFLIAELFKAEFLNLKIMISIVRNIADTAETYGSNFEYLCTLLGLSGEKLEIACKVTEFKAVEEVRRGITPKINERDFMDNLFDKMMSAATDPSLSPKIKFMLEGVFELREYGCWKKKAVQKL